MIEQYLSNTNESTTVSIFQNFLEVNKALGDTGSRVLDVYFHPEEPKRIHRRFRNFCNSYHWTGAVVVYSDSRSVLPGRDPLGSTWLLRGSTGAAPGPHGETPSRHRGPTGPLQTAVLVALGASGPTTCRLESPDARGPHVIKSNLGLVRD